ncbi:MAG: hypothetical protein Q4D16_23390 [Eubacteriales bacterium]|nr:hypothetical protein [Eubacteriales bacterium]
MHKALDNYIGIRYNYYIVKRYIGKSYKAQRYSGRRDIIWKRWH